MVVEDFDSSKLYSDLSPNSAFFGWSRDALPRQHSIPNMSARPRSCALVIEWEQVPATV